MMKEHVHQIFTEKKGLEITRSMMMMIISSIHLCWPKNSNRNKYLSL